MQKRFYDANLHGVDWKQVGKTYHARLSTVKNRGEFETLMNQMLGELHASHTAYVTLDDAEYSMLLSVNHQDMQQNAVEHIGVMGQREGREYVVSAVLNGGPAEKAKIEVGDRLLLADGQPFTSAGSFRGKAGTPVQVLLKRVGEASTRTVMVTPIKANMLRSFLDATLRSARVMESGGKKIAYVHLWTMAHEAFRSTLEHIVLNKLYDADGLILDLRDGYGGHPFGYADVFFRPDVTWESQTHDRKAVIEHTGYNKPVVALINGGTRSAKEFLSYQLKTSRRATLVGTRTAGAFLGAEFDLIGDEGLLELARVGLKVNGDRLENNGVTPDVLVPAKDTYMEQDAQLAQAKQTLLNLLPDRAPETNKPAIIHVH